MPVRALVVGIHDVVVARGAIVAAIWDRPFRTSVQTMITNGRAGVAPERIGEVVATALSAAKPRTRDPVVKGRFMNTTLPSLPPKRTVDRLIGRQLGVPPT